MGQMEKKLYIKIETHIGVTHEEAMKEGIRLYELLKIDIMVMFNGKPYWAHEWTEEARG